MAPWLILDPYERRQSPGVVLRSVAGLALVLVAAFYGLLCAIAPINIVIMFLAPVALLIGVILWLLPDSNVVNLPMMETLFLWFIGFSLLWPNYIAVNIPGLPWITPTRFTLLLLLALFLVNFATSRDMRAAVWEAANGIPYVRTLFVAFWGITTLSVVFAVDKSGAFNKYLNNQIYWTFVFFTSCYLTSKPGFIDKFVKLNLVALFILAIIGLIETRLQKVFWIDYLPEFLKIDPELIVILKSTQSRVGVDLYRARGVYAVALYFAEYLALLLPFAFHAVYKSKSVLQFSLLSLGTVAIVVVMWATGARSAIAGLLVSSVVYLFAIAYRSRVTKPNSIVANATLIGFPVLAVLSGAAVMFWPRLHRMVLGGAEHEGSTEARVLQWQAGMPKVLTHPFGHGSGQAADIVGFFNGSNPNATLDTWYLGALVDYGYFGLPLFILTMITAALFGIWGHSKARKSSHEYMAPLALALLSFVMTTSILAYEGIFPIAFAMLGCLVGLYGQHRQSLAPAVKALPATRPRFAALPQRA